MDSLEIINLISIIFIIFFSGIVSWKRLKQNNASCIFYACYFVIFGIFQILPFLFDASSPIASFSAEIRLKSNILNIGILLALFLGENLVFQKTRVDEESFLKYINRKRVSSYLSILMWVTLGLSICGFLISIWAKGVPFNIETLLSAKARSGYLTSLRSGIALTIGNWLLSLVLISNYISLIKKKRLALATGVFLILALISITGTRAYIFYIVGPFLYYYITTRKIKFKNIILLTVLLIMFILIFGTAHLWRWQSERTPETFLKLFLSKETHTFLFSYQASEFNRAISNFQAVELFPKKYDWLYGNTYKTIFLFWLPSRTAQGVKEDTMYKFSDAVRGTTTSYQERASYHPTFTGDCYINFGYLFWLPALIFGAVFSMIYIKSRRSIFWNLLAGSSLVYFLVLLFRGSIYQAFFEIIFCAVFLFLAIFLLSAPYSRSISKI